MAFLAASLDSNAFENNNKKRTLFEAAQAAAALSVPEADEGVPGESPSERRLGAERLQRFIIHRRL